MYTYIIDSCPKPKSVEQYNAMDSDSGIEFDQMLSATLKILGYIMEIVFQPGATSSNDESMKIQFNVYIHRTSIP